jgi:hypothetical protein
MKRKLMTMAVAIVAALGLLAGCASPVQDLQQRAEATWGPQSGWTRQQRMAYLTGLQVLMGGEARADQGYAEQRSAQSVADSINSLAVSNSDGEYHGGEYLNQGITSAGDSIAAGIVRRKQRQRNLEAAEAVMLTLGQK